MTIIECLWPTREKPAEINPEHLFKQYEDAVQRIGSEAPTPDDVKLLAQSWKIFDNEVGRRTTIDSRAAAVMPAISLVVTLITGVGFTVLKDTSVTLDARMTVLSAFLLALVYLIRTMLLVFLVHGKVYRSTLDPTDVIPSSALSKSSDDLSAYDRMVACKLLNYTIANYRANNIQSDNLFVAQRAFRNSILVLALGGVIAVIMLFAHSALDGSVQSQKIVPNASDLISQVAHEGRPSHGLPSAPTARAEDELPACRVARSCCEPG